MAEYWLADEVKEIAERYIPTHHPHLASARIGYLFRDKASRSKLCLDGSAERITYGKAGRIGSSKMEVLTEKDFVIEIGYDEWQQASQAFREYLVDHELSHCGGEEDPDLTDGSMKWYMVPHDVEEFISVVSRHGLMKDDLREFHRACLAAEQEAKKKIYATVASDQNGSAPSVPDVQPGDDSAAIEAILDSI